MAEEEKQEEKFDFTAEGEALGFVTLDQARFVAMQTAPEEPGNYGPAWQTVPMVFEVINAEETEDDYSLILFFRPEGEFTGTPGREQFVFRNKIGQVAFRQVLNYPKARSRWPRPIIIAGVAGVVGGVALGASSLFGSGPFGAPSLLAPTTVPTFNAVINATSTPNPTPVPTPHEPPVVAIPPAHTSVPTDTPMPAPSSVPEAPLTGGAFSGPSGEPKVPFLLTPNLSLSETRGQPGSSITVAGSGFAANEKGITVTLNHESVASGISAGGDGSWAASFLIPSIPANSYPVRASGPETSSRSMTGEFLTIVPVLFISPGAGGPGQRSI